MIRTSKGAVAPYAHGRQASTSIHAGGSGSASARVEALQRLVGNTAVTRLLQRQSGPEPADAGAPAGAPVPTPTGAAPADQSPAPAPTPGEQAPVELPLTGDLPIMFSETPRQWLLDTEEVDKLNIGKGSFSTPPIPAAKWLSVSVKAGSEEAAKPSATLTLSPISGVIRASAIEAKRPSHRTAGIIGAAAGGIYGGLVGGVAGGLLAPGLGLLGPVLGAREGAGTGGVLGGRAAESLAQRFDGRIDLEAELLTGTLTGALAVRYAPYVTLSFTATGFSWLASLEPTLKTRMNLVLRASATLEKSRAKLSFEGGRLVRSEFELKPEVRLGIEFDALARLVVALRLLPFLDDSEFAGADGKQPLAEQRELKLLESNEFRLFSYAATRATSGRLNLAKGSPLQVRGTKLGLDEALSMKALLPAAMENAKPLPTGSAPPKSGTSETEPIESDFTLSPDAEILARMTPSRTGKKDWFRGRFIGFERLSRTTGRPAGEGEATRLFLAFTVEFPNQQNIVRINSSDAHEDLQNPKQARQLRYFEDPILRESLEPYLAHPLLVVGPNAKGSIPSSNPEKVEDFESKQIQLLGNQDGCHVSAGHSAGGKAWVGDHQPPTKLWQNKVIESSGQRLYPMCKSCSDRQGPEVSRILRMWLGRKP